MQRFMLLVIIWMLIVPTPVIKAQGNCSQLYLIENRFFYRWTFPDGSIERPFNAAYGVRNVTFAEDHTHMVMVLYDNIEDNFLMAAAPQSNPDDLSILADFAIRPLDFSLSPDGSIAGVLDLSTGDLCVERSCYRPFWGG